MPRINVWKPVHEGKILMRGCIETTQQIPNQRDALVISLLAITRFTDPYTTAGEFGTGWVKYRVVEPSRISDIGTYEPLGEINVYGMHDQGKADEELAEMLDSDRMYCWLRNHPLWYSEQQVIITRRSNEREELTGEATLKIMQHYAALQQALVPRYLAAKQSNDSLMQAFLETLYDRLQAFRRHMDRLWQPVTA